MDLQDIEEEKEDGSIKSGQSAKHEVDDDDKKSDLSLKSEDIIQCINMSNDCFSEENSVEADVSDSNEENGDF